MAGYVKISSKGQITLPAAIRNHLEIEPGMYLSVVEDGEGIYIAPVKGELSNLRGAVAVDGLQDFNKIRHQTMEDLAIEKAKSD